jgi:AmmeMemoRadiSam system protein B
MASTITGGYVRRAHHAGSWYSDDSQELEVTLTKYMNDASEDMMKQQDIQEQSTSAALRAVICPHAGYRYSGPTAAYSYWCLQQELCRPECSIRYIVVLHPSHHYYLNGCAVSGASQIQTPIIDLQVSSELRNQVLALNSTPEGQTHPFTVMDRHIDEEEHSGEMQYPYIALALKNAAAASAAAASAAAAAAAAAAITTNAPIHVLPIMCGNIDSKQETGYGKLLAPIINRQDVLCVISTDFCHYGRRFSYQPQPSTLPLAEHTTTTTSNSNSDSSTSTSTMKLYQYITQLDREGMDYIELQRPGAFADYLRRTKNTICGRHAIQTWLNGVVDTQNSLDVKFIKYAQSSQVHSAVRDSSVSYASATARVARQAP